MQVKYGLPSPRLSREVLPSQAASSLSSPAWRDSAAIMGVENPPLPGIAPGMRGSTPIPKAPWGAKEVTPLHFPSKVLVSGEDAM